MRCYLFMVSFTVTDRSTICVLEENIIPSLGEFINVDPSDRWTVEDLISKFARKEAVTKDDVTVGYVLLSVPERSVEVSLKEQGTKEVLHGLKELTENHGFKFVS
ncbi:MAG: TA0956 family protein [Thermoplasmatales archaeon]|nr:TA0956 family protein [Thermoplasmatales archaeon]